MRHFGTFRTSIYIIYTAFLGSKSSKKDKNMMSCTRLYAYSKEALMGQSRKRRLLSFIMEWSENIRGQNWSNIIPNTKDTNQVFKKHKNSIQRGIKLDLKVIYQHYMLSLKCPILLLELVLSVLYLQISNLLLLCSIPCPTLVGILPKHSKRHKISIQRGRKLDLKILQQEQIGRFSVWIINRGKWFLVWYIYQNQCIKW